MYRIKLSYFVLSIFSASWSKSRDWRPCVGRTEESVRSIYAVRQRLKQVFLDASKGIYVNAWICTRTLALVTSPVT